MTAFVEEHRGRWGVEPICVLLQFAPSTYYAVKTRPPSRRSVTDAGLKEQIMAVYKDNFEVYGAEKVWRVLHRDGVAVGRDRVARLMRELNIAGAVRGRRTPRTTQPAGTDERPDLVRRQFTVDAPNRLWVADITYVELPGCFAYTAFVTDAFSRRIVGWQVADTLRERLVLEALDLAIWTRRGEGQRLTGLVHHSDRGGQYIAVRYTQRLANEEALLSVGSRGDSYDNALAETVNGLYKTELVRRHGPWRSLRDVEIATAEWVHWYNTRRLHEACGWLSPVEFEAAYYRRSGQEQE